MSECQCVLYAQWLNTICFIHSDWAQGTSVSLYNLCSVIKHKIWVSVCIFWVTEHKVRMLVYVLSSNTRTSCSVTVCVFYPLWLNTRSDYLNKIPNTNLSWNTRGKSTAYCLLPCNLSLFNRMQYKCTSFILSHILQYSCSVYR